MLLIEIILAFDSKTDQKVMKEPCLEILSKILTCILILKPRIT